MTELTREQKEFVPDQDLLNAILRGIKIGREFTKDELSYIHAALADYNRLRNIVGEVTVSTNEKGECVAVTRTDDEHRILSVIWERAR